MDLPSLSMILRATLSLNPDERKPAEHSLDQLQFAPLHLVRLLQIIVDNNCDTVVRQVASIHFKNFIAKYWTPDEPNEQQRISLNDKNLVRENILPFVSQVPLVLRVQLGECLKTMIDADYPKQWPTLLDWVKHNLQGLQVYGALFLLRILAKKYEFKSYDERIPVSRIVRETFPHLLNIFSSLVQIANPSLEVAELIKLICKIFWSATYLEIPKQLLDQNVFDGWMTLFLILLERPVPLEGQDWWKVKKRTIQILNRLYTRFGDSKIQNPENRVFALMFLTNYAGKILECHLSILNAIPAGSYLPDRVTNLILQYLTTSISRSSMYSLLQPRLGFLLFKIIFPLMCFNDNDQKLWDEDPHEYVRKGYDIIEDICRPRTAAMDFVKMLVRKRGKENLHKFVQFIVGIFRRYDEAELEYIHYCQKDGALLAVGVLCDKLKQTEPYKSELEKMLVQNVYPEFSSPVGHLRAKAAWVAGQYAHINFADPNNFRRALHFVVSGLRDAELPVRVDSVFALRSFVEACRDRSEIRTILPQLLDEIFKLMNEVENEDLVFTLETIVIKFGDEMAPYAQGLCQNLAAAILSGDSGGLAAVGCLRAISSILESVSRLPDLFVQIEPTLLPIMRKMLTADGQDVFEEVLEIVSYMTFYSPTISLDMWSLWPLMVEALADWAMDFFQNIMVPLDNYISRGTARFLTCKEPDYQLSLWNMISSIMADNNLEDDDIEPAPKLIQVVFENCRELVDHWTEPYLKITVDRLRRTEKPRLKCFLIQVIADALYYNATYTLGILHKLGVATEVFNLWFQLLQQVRKSGLMVNFKREHDKKVCCLGLTSLLALPADQLPGEALVSVFRANLDLLVAYKDQVAEAAKEEDAEYDDDDMDGIQTDNDEGDGSDKEMDEDEADNVRQQKLALLERSLRAIDDDDDDLYDHASDDEELQSPIDGVDPFVFFLDTVKAMQASDPMRFQNLTQTLDRHYQARANGVVQHAEQRRVEIEMETTKKASAVAAS